VRFAFTVNEPLNADHSLCGQSQSRGTFKKATEVWRRNDAQGSIRIQEGQPTREIDS
jgi:hypothetical protein